MVRGGTERSLLLIDEFGKGTAPADGIGLVAALVRHLSRMHRKCLFTLHFHEIFRWKKDSKKRQTYMLLLTPRDYFYRGLMVFEA